MALETLSKINAVNRHSCLEELEISALVLISLIFEHKMILKFVWSCEH